MVNVDMPEVAVQVERNAIKFAIPFDETARAIGQVARVNAGAGQHIAQRRQQSARGVVGNAAAMQHHDIRRRASGQVGVQLGDAGPVHHYRIDDDLVLLSVEGVGESLNDAAFAVCLRQVSGFAEFIGAFAEEAHKCYFGRVLRGGRHSH